MYVKKVGKNAFLCDHDDTHIRLHSRMMIMMRDKSLPVKNTSFSLHSHGARPIGPMHSVHTGHDLWRDAAPLHRMVRPNHAI